MYITREEAADVLDRIEGSGILDPELEAAVGEMAMVLRFEDEHKLSLWGAGREADDLFTAKRSDLITPEWERHCEELYEKYKIKL